MHRPNIQKEIEVLKLLRHENIIRCYHTHEQDGRFYLIMELAEKGSLANVITNKRLDWPTKCRLAHEIARGLEYIHGENYLHRGLRSSNVLLTQHMQVKLCDAWLPTVRSMTATQTGSAVIVNDIRWMAPEFRYSAMADVYALGMVMWEMAANCNKPYKDCEDAQMIAALIRDGVCEELPDDTPEEYRRWVEKCWQYDPTSRPQARDVVLIMASPDLQYSESEVAVLSANASGSRTIINSQDAHDISKNKKNVAANEVSKSNNFSTGSTHVRATSSPIFSSTGNNPLSTMSNISRNTTGSISSKITIVKPPTVINNNLFNSTTTDSSPRANISSPPAAIRSNPFSTTSGSQGKTLSRLESRARRPLSRDLLSLDVGTLTRMIERSDTLALAGLVERYRKAAASGDTEAQTILGWAYDNGKGVQQNGAEAAMWYRRAADQGSVEAQVNLGSLYLSGRGVSQSDSEAATWYRRAAESGSTTAQNNLGWMHECGIGVPQDYTKAVSWYRRAAEKGDSAAQQRLGEMYSVGLGVNQSEIEAAYWFRRAAGKTT
ncbi:hypothetical protein BGW42_005987 [Actinomortierella wolfii]|nr:hypothetical protein BGW42_005987 [Actinomortierella wolfii]